MKTILLILLISFVSLFSYSQPQEYSSDDAPWNMKIEFKSSGQVMYKAKGRQSFYNIKNKNYDKTVLPKNEKVVVLVNEFGGQGFIVIDENDIVVLQRQVYDYKRDTEKIKFTYIGYQWKDGIIIQEYDMNFIYTSDMSKTPCRYFYDAIEDVTVLIEYTLVEE